MTIAEQPCRQAERVRAALRDQPGAGAQRLREQLEHFLPLVQQAIAQAVRRVLHGEVVPAADKIVSLFEPHTQIIQRHKVGKPVNLAARSGWRKSREAWSAAIVSPSKLDRIIPI